MDFWPLITRLGDSSLLAPVAVFVFCWLAYRREPAKAGLWLLLFGFSTALVVGSKLAFMGWGIGIPNLNFTGISGHSMLAGAVLPTLAAQLFTSRRAGLAAAALAAVVAVLVGLSRLAIHVHSPAEVYAGLALGLGTSAAFLAATRAQLPAFHPAALLLVVALALGQTATGVRAPTHQLLERIAAHLADRDQPFQRGQWGGQPDV
ncbi:phosphatidic acid phosphatase [Pseudomonas sp. 21]|uniref:phosphatase PAP2 family protein n=1 Tax=unclassified Pseudomonas TaxID=196821 RepID=UPI0005EAD017|nr:MULTISPECIES: phosphatase PAP2 family protein [unclassified Pseudomonas]KJJ96067.1 phosphatidic acid phosphatase [Pseudomonas sp. 21]MBV7586718.1 phosphatase PAP2 family protein [Pseudomonas sp. PDM33]